MSDNRKKIAELQAILKYWIIESHLQVQMFSNDFISNTQIRLEDQEFIPFFWPNFSNCVSFSVIRYKSNIKKYP